LKNRKLTDEHVFPDSLGGQYHIYCVCKECNEYLGEKVDFPLVNNLLMQFARLSYQLRGKNGQLPKIFDKGVLDNDTKINVILQTDNKGKIVGTKMVPHKELSEDGESVLFQVDLKDKKILPIMVNKFLKRANRPTMKAEEILRHSLTQKENSKIKLNKNVDLNIHQEFLKIAYEIAFEQLGAKYLNDPIGIKLRKWIMENIPSKIHGRVNVVDKNNKRHNTLIQLFGKDNSIVSLLVQCGNDLLCYINFFNDLEGVVHVSENLKIPHNLYLVNNVEQKYFRIEKMTDVIEKSMFN
jgi:G:T/U-mismatch repair DNA glycosylase